MLMKGRLRSLTRNVYRTWLGGLLTSVLLTCLLLYTWMNAPLPLPLHLSDLYRWSSTPSTTPTTLSLPTFLRHVQAPSKDHNSVLSRRVEVVGERTGEGPVLARDVIQGRPLVLQPSHPVKGAGIVSRAGLHHQGSAHSPAGIHGAVRSSSSSIRSPAGIHAAVRSSSSSIRSPAGIHSAVRSSSNIRSPAGILAAVSSSSSIRSPAGIHGAVMSSSSNIRSPAGIHAAVMSSSSSILAPGSQPGSGSSRHGIAAAQSGPPRGAVGNAGKGARGAGRNHSDDVTRSGGGEGVGVCSPLHHLVLVKVHKAASSTVANIVQRYGFTRDLNFVLPNRQPKTLAYNYISKRGEVFTPEFILPPPSGQNYDLLWNHAIYNSSLFRSFMPADTVYVSILREPFQQFVSAFAFYNAPYIDRFVALKINPFTHYLHHMQHPELLDYFRNKQAEDLGMGPEHVLNATLRQQYLRQLNGELGLVLITEFFDESLVLLRRLMCWSVKDVLYISKNQNSFKPIFVFSQHDYARHRQLAEVDYDLYDFFRLKFLRTLSALGVDFDHELAHFRDVLKGIQRFCQQAPEAPKQFFVPRSPWSGEFAVTMADCQLLVMPELAFLDKLVNASLAKLRPPSPDGRPHDGHVPSPPQPPTAQAIPHSSPTPRYPVTSLMTHPPAIPLRHSSPTPCYPITSLMTHPLLSHYVTHDPPPCYPITSLMTHPLLSHYVTHDPPPAIPLRHSSPTPSYPITSLLTHPLLSHYVTHDPPHAIPLRHSSPTPSYPITSLLTHPTLSHYVTPHPPRPIPLRHS